MDWLGPSARGGDDLCKLGSNLCPDLESVSISCMTGGESDSFTRGVAGEMSCAMASSSDKSKSYVSSKPALVLGASSEVEVELSASVGACLSPDGGEPCTHIGCHSSPLYAS